MNEPAAEFNWLHISDFHAGMIEARWIWPQVRSALLADIRKEAARLGRIDAIFFTGDVSQSGGHDQFLAASDALKAIVAELPKGGSSIPLFVVPGNHDLVRPKKDAPSSILLDEWERHESVRSDTFSGEPNIYSEAISDSFKNYVEWQNTFDVDGLYLPSSKYGIVPGDFSSTINSSIGTVGVVGLNSTFLQIGAGNYEGRLALEIAQILAITNNDPDNWVKSNSFSVILTHQPISWLSARTVEHWNSDIAPPDRFYMHMFGHMHEPDTTVTSHGGSQPRRSVQAASLCGLDFIEGGIQRTHGYSLGSTYKEAEEWTTRIWPRRLEKLASGERRFVPDFRLGLEDDVSYYIGGSNGAKRTPTSLAVIENSSEIWVQKDRAGLLDKLKAYLPKSPASFRVRAVERHTCKAALDSRHAIWLVADWGAGDEAFIASTQQDRVEGFLPTYRISFQDFEGKDSFLSNIRSRIGFSFEQILEVLGDGIVADILIDDIPVYLGDQIANARIEDDIEEIISVLIQVCPDARVFMRSVHRPASPTYPVVELGPLEEADLRQYLIDHEQGGEELSKPDTVASLYRYTDGWPARIDGAMRELKVVSIEQLANSDRDLTNQTVGADEAPDALVEAVTRLSSADDPAEHRAYMLLLALSAFPQGETLERVRRFYGVHPLTTSNAQMLLDASLAISTSSREIHASEAIATPILTIPRPVRDYVRSVATKNDLDLTTRSAASVYFGSNWMTGQIGSSANKVFASQVTSSHELVNGSAIITRLMSDAIAEGDQRALDAAVDISIAFVSALQRGDHFRNIVTFAHRILALMPEEMTLRRNQIRYNLGLAIRMVQDGRDAIEILEPLISEKFSSNIKLVILATLSLCHQKLGHEEKAVEYAKRVIKSEPKSLAALQGKAIILELDKDRPGQIEELRKFEALCRKKGAHVTANNLALARSYKLSNDPDGAERALMDVIKYAADHHDTYNMVRAVVGRARLWVRRSAQLSPMEVRQIIHAYRYLFSERLNVLFDNCHEALWSILKNQGELSDILKLFKQSSTLWRLRGDSEIEQRYLKELAGLVAEKLDSASPNISRELAYFFVRRGNLA